MLIKRRRGWEIPESQATPESVVLNRRALLAAMPLAAGPMLAPGAFAQTPDPSARFYPAMRNARYTVERAITGEQDATTYNNYYEFGTSKSIWRAAQAKKLRPWTVSIEGMVEEPRTVDIDTLIAAMPLEERVYRFRCVEAWAMTVPWTGFPMKALVEYARPLSSARYVEMQTWMDPKVGPGFRQSWYPWPYTEGLTMAEATNELTLMVTGMYGKPAPSQNGAPIRLITPWKYGFKSVKGIVRIRFTDKRPVGLWEAIQSSEYGFWANVNPDVPHPRWSQASERLLGSGERVPTRIWNGYGEFVADLYKDMPSRERLFA